MERRQTHTACAIFAIVFLQSSSAQVQPLLARPGTPAPPQAVSLNRALCQAADTGNIARVKALLAQGADVNAAQQNGWTALMLAANNGHASVAALLLGHGADARRRSILYNDVDALMLAAQTGSVPICRLLLAHGVNVNERDSTTGDTPLMSVVGNVNISPKRVYQTTRFLLQHGADVQAKDISGNTPLSIALGSIKEEPRLMATARLLRNAGATSPELKDLTPAPKSGTMTMQKLAEKIFRAHSKDAHTRRR